MIFVRSLQYLHSQNEPVFNYQIYNVSKYTKAL